ncbi:hypothetical protein [Bradyrhizobium lupini]|uniref:hypothetical protein n=1 Tax=Rhizobium lupini TaxID=136996 RepID=UPI0034C67807
MSDEMEEIKIETACHEAGHAVMGCLLERLPISVSIVADVKGAVDKTEFEQDAPPGGFRHFDESERKKKYIRTRFDRGRGHDRARHRISGARS